MTTSTHSPVAPETLLGALKWRYATKAFDPTRTIPAADWQVLEESLLLAPSSFGLQPYRFVVVTDPALRAQLRPVSYGQSQITDASHLVVFLAKQEMTEAYVDQFLAQIVQTRGGKLEDLRDYRSRMVGSLVGTERNIPEWTARQAYICLRPAPADRRPHGRGRLPHGGSGAEGLRSDPGPGRWRLPHGGRMRPGLSQRRRWLRKTAQGAVSCRTTDSSPLNFGNSCFHGDRGLRPPGLLYLAHGLSLRNLPH